VIVLAILVTFVAVVASVVIALANGMRSSASSGSGFMGLGIIIAAWIVTAVLWLAWWVG
jgi:hypothetical protein